MGYGRVEARRRIQARARARARARVRVRAAHRVVHEREWLALLHCAARLAQAVLGEEVALGDEDHDDGRLLDVLLEGADVLVRGRVGLRGSV